MSREDARSYLALGDSYTIGEGVEGGGSVLRDLDLEALPLQQVGERVGEIRLILDDQDAGHDGSPFVGATSRAALGLLLFFCFLGLVRRLPLTSVFSGGSTTLSRTVNVEPRPGRDHSSTSPPCRCTACFTIDRPSPVPCAR